MVARESNKLDLFLGGRKIPSKARIPTPRGSCDGFLLIMWSQPAGLKIPDASYYRARYYDSNSGRFLSEDPIRFEGGINPYRYGANSPTSFIDPLGLAECVYSVAQHTMICTSNNPPPAVGPQWQVQVGPNGVASGADQCKNNDDCVNSRNKGPITPGRYRMNADTRPQHQGWGLYRLEPWPHHWYNGLLYDLGLSRGGFELHIGSVTFGCIDADKTNSQAVDQYHAMQFLLQAEDGNNYLTVLP